MNEEPVEIGGIRIPRHVTVESLERVAAAHPDIRYSSALKAISLVLQGATLDEAARSVGVRNGTVQIAAERITAAGGLSEKGLHFQGSRERELRDAGGDADGLERASRLYTDRSQGDRVRWVASFFRGTPASTIAGTVGVPEEDVLGWVEDLRSSGLDAFPDAGGRILEIPSPVGHTRFHKTQYATGATENSAPELSEQSAARQAFLAEASARAQRRRERRDEAHAELHRPGPGPDEVRLKMIGTRTDADMDFLIQTAMDEDQKRKLAALRLAATTGTVQEAGADFGFTERLMYWYGSVLGRKGPGGLMAGRAALKPFVPRLTRSDLEAVHRAALEEGETGAAMKAVLRLVQGEYPPEVARDAGMAMAELQALVANASEIAASVNAHAGSEGTRDPGEELRAAGYTSSYLAALVTPERSDEGRTRAKALRLLVRGEDIGRVCDTLQLDETHVLQLVDAVLDEGGDALLDERHDRLESFRSTM